ncbi:hypothetical protein SAMN05444159_3516 [Bradyrhizobium lablabi]|uniref:Uncharacterized protein n=1 Tax=Bradyrhizobium lablabi TaxID=722472 RepID=A0A1M6TA35_9BRAD|nr:hypothetical protein [Bradyrhizobium lablabi]SHK53709.1 hypothetical protein SAMN05444159_3516 [Bradyrhizobium lablabi]
MALAVDPVPRDYRQRKKLWVNSSLWLGINERPYVPLAVQGLGYAERMLLEMEERLAEMTASPGPRNARDRLLSECSSHSVLWVFGLYEVVRVIKDARTHHFEAMRNLFWQLEVLRMPLAKHEVKRTDRKEAPPVHYPTNSWEPETGRVGWISIDPLSHASRVVTRHEFADEFLSVTAFEPASQPPFPIGGQLGLDD